MYRNSNSTTFSSSNDLEAGVVITVGVLFAFVLPVILICLCSRPRSRENGLDEEGRQLFPKDNNKKSCFFSIGNGCFETETETETESEEVFISENFKRKGW